MSGSSVAVQDMDSNTVPQLVNMLFGCSPMTALKSPDSHSRAKEKCRSEGSTELTQREQSYSVPFAVADGPSSTTVCSFTGDVAAYCCLSLGRPLPRTVLNSSLPKTNSGMRPKTSDTHATIASTSSVLWLRVSVILLKEFLRSDAGTN